MPDHVKHDEKNWSITQQTSARKSKNEKLQRIQKKAIH